MVKKKFFVKLIYLIPRDFLAWTFLNFLPTVEYKVSILPSCKKISFAHLLPIGMNQVGCHVNVIIILSLLDLTGTKLLPILKCHCNRVIIKCREGWKQTDPSGVGYLCPIRGCFAPVLSTQVGLIII